MNQTTFRNSAVICNTLLLLSIALSTTACPAQSPDLPTQKPANQADRQLAKGVVYCDLNGDGKYNAGDSAFVGIKVSNGTDIVKTGRRGRYEIPIEDGGCVFVIKPNGYRTPVDQHQLPRFFYLHKPQGSPELKYKGSEPSGPLPQSIDFPLYRQKEPEDFKILLFGDPQPRNNTEVDYISHDVVEELIGNDSAFGVTLGDIAFDNLNTFKTINQSIAMIGIPWYNVIGNHDINTDAKTRKLINETFEATYGPSYYSFDYGQVHFVVLDNIDWVMPTEENQQAHYAPRFGKRQLAFLKKDLAMIAKSRMLVVLMHIPIVSVGDKEEFFDLIKSRPYCVSVSGHTHDHRHLFLGKKEGFHGAKKHHHIVNVTVSGSWWSGALNDNQIPHSTMADGAPNGYSIMSFDQDGYKLDFKAAGRPASEQLRIHLPSKACARKTGEVPIWVNVYNGSEESQVEYRIDRGSEWIELTKTFEPDPYFVELSKRDKDVEPKLAGPRNSYHLWKGTLPAGLAPGAHLIEVKTTDRHGRVYQAHRSLRVTEKPIEE
ncbi:MAG: calcineurin-like phosphoesterase family protein [Pirellulales bacterium]|nr:calcineurin-like phosphoesterase family protein [Pirellulales bacterium]